MGKKRWLYGWIVSLSILVLCTGCSVGKTKTAEPTTVTLWHVYGGQADSPLNAFIDVFNSTVGRKENIRVQVTSVTNTNTIHENVLAAAFKDPGAPELPDMFISYPKTVMAMPSQDVLVDYQDYFSKTELEEFIPEFIEEGMINDRLSVLPIAKSTEILFVNKTAFDRFSSETGASLEEMNTWEGLYALAEKYTKWTDDKTPNIPGDGKSFFVHDYHFNYFQVGVESLGEAFFEGDHLAFGPKFEEVWKPYAHAALNGSVWLQGGYATEPLRTGDAIVSVASSASVLYYPEEVTYPDNTSEPIDIISIPCPIFEEGERIVMQRGAGLCTVKSTPEREKACMTFAKWLTDAKHNVEFVTALGYMPVKQESFETYLPNAVNQLGNEMYRSLYRAFLSTQEDYQFYTPPKVDTYLNLETQFEEKVRLILSAGREAVKSGNTDTDLLVEKTLEELKESN